MSIRDFATELLRQIFYIAVHSEVAVLLVAAGNHNSPRTSMSLSHTCSFWRQICLQYPELWTFLPADQMSVELRRLFVERSASKPLVLLFDNDEGA